MVLFSKHKKILIDITHALEQILHFHCLFTLKNLGDLALSYKWERLMHKDSDINNQWPGIYLELSK